MCTFLGFPEVELGASYHHLVAVSYELADELLEVECLGAAVYERDIVHAEGCLHLGHLVELVEDHVGVGVALELDDYAHSLVVALVVDVGDAVEFLFSDEVSYIGYEFGFVDVVRDFGDDDVLMVVLRLYFGFRTNQDASASGLIGFLHTVVAVDGASGGEVGCGDVFHQLRNVDFGLFKICDTSVDRFGEVMGWHVGCHTYRDA